MPLPFALVIFLALRGRHIFESLVWGTLFALVLSLGIGTLRPGEIFSVPAELVIVVVISALTGWNRTYTTTPAEGHAAR